MITFARTDFGVGTGPSRNGERRIMTVRVPAVVRLGEGIFFALLVILLLRKITDFDLWYHLAIGREVAQTFALPAYEFLVYPNADQKGAFHEWGFGLLFYLSHEMAGYRGMSLLNALIGGATLWLLFRAGSRKPWTNPAYLLVLLALFWWVHFRLTYRPEMLLYLALACEILLLERFLESPGKRWLAPIPVLGFLLVQAHPSALFLLAMLGAYALQVARNHRDRADRLLEFGVWFLLCAVGLVGVSLVNPYGSAQVLLPLSFASQHEVLRDVVEFLPTFQTGYKWPYLLLAAGSLVAVVVQPRKRIVDWILLLVFGYLAYRYVRNVALFALVMYVPMARATAYLVQRCPEYLARPRFPTRALRTRVLFWGAALAAGLYTFASGVSDPDWGAGSRPGQFPESAARVINELRPPGRILNFYDMGGYLAWRLKGDYQVFIDGRHYKMNRALRLHDSVLRGDPGWRRVLDRYGINTIVTPATLMFSGMLIPLVAILGDDPEWELAAREDRALLFFRHEVSQSLPARYRLDKRQIWQQVAKEAQATLEDHPDQPKAHLSLGEAFERLGDRPRAVEAYRRYLELEPADDEIARRLAALDSQ